MLWTYGLVVIVIGVVSGIAFHLLIKNKKQANIFTAIVILIAVLAAYIMTLRYSYTSTEGYENIARQESPFLNLVADNAPTEFRDYVSKVKENQDNHGNPKQEIFYSIELINNLLMKFGPYASTESLYTYLKKNIEFDKKMEKINPLLVLVHEFPDKFPNKDQIDMSKLDINEYKTTILNAAEKVITSSIENPQPKPTSEEIEKAKKIFREILDAQIKKYGSELVLTTLKNPDDPTLDKKVAAEIVISLAENILAKGKEEAALILKASFLIGSES